MAAAYSGWGRSRLCRPIPRIQDLNTHWLEIHADGPGPYAAEVGNGIRYPWLSVYGGCVSHSNKTLQFPCVCVTRLRQRTCWRGDCHGPASGASANGAQLPGNAFWNCVPCNMELTAHIGWGPML